MINCKWEIINYRDNECECDLCINNMCEECDNETQELEYIEFD